MKGLQLAAREIAWVVEVKSATHVLNVPLKIDRHVRTFLATTYRPAYLSVPKRLYHTWPPSVTGFAVRCMQGTLPAGIRARRG